jgi:hypothetical protein
MNFKLHLKPARKFEEEGRHGDPNHPTMRQIKTGNPLVCGVSVFSLLRTCQQIASRVA